MGVKFLLALYGSDDEAVTLRAEPVWWELLPTDMQVQLVDSPFLVGDPLRDFPDTIMEGDALPTVVVTGVDTWDISFTSASSHFGFSYLAGKLGFSDALVPDYVAPFGPIYYHYGNQYASLTGTVLPSQSAVFCGVFGSGGSVTLSPSPPSSREDTLYVRQLFTAGNVLKTIPGWAFAHHAENPDFDVSLWSLTVNSLGQLQYQSVFAAAVSGAGVCPLYPVTSTSSYSTSDYSLYIQYTSVLSSWFEYIPGAGSPGGEPEPLPPYVPGRRFPFEPLVPLVRMAQEFFPWGLSAGIFMIDASDVTIAGEVVYYNDPS